MYFFTSKKKKRTLITVECTWLNKAFEKMFLFIGTVTFPPCLDNNSKEPLNKGPTKHHFEKLSPSVCTDLCDIKVALHNRTKKHITCISLPRL